MIKIKLNESSNILEAEYEPETKILTVTFVNGIKYEYYDIEMSTILDWQNAESVGKFFAQYIRNKPFKRLEK